jgi:secretion/DNA translocation related TadE-like protein
VSRARDDRGSVTLLVVATAALILFVAAALGVVAAMVVAHRVAQSGADLAALAGAEAGSQGLDACAAAADVARANGVRLTGCEPVGTTVTVRVEAPGPRWLDQTADLSARSRAGPAPP